MPRALRRANVDHMSGWCSWSRVLAAGVVVVKQRSDEAGAAAAAAPRRSAPRRSRRSSADCSPTPPDPATILRERGRAAGARRDPPARRRRLDGRAPSRGSRPFADVGSRGASCARCAATSAATSRALNRLSDKGGVSIAEAERTLAEVYSAPVLERLGARGPARLRRALAGRTQVAQRIKVARLPGRLRLRPARAGPGRLPALDARAVRPLRRPRAADLDRHARPRGRPLALRRRASKD